MTTTTGRMDREVKITKKVFTRSVRVLYVVYSHTKVVLTLIELHVLIDSLTVSPFFTAKTFYEELDINNVCVLIYIFRSANKITTLTTALIHSFRVWYVQCLAKRLTMNFIEFIHWKVWRSFDSLAVKDLLKNWTTTTSAARLQNPTAFSFKTV